MTASPAIAANALQPVSVIVFPGGFNWPIWIAQDLDSAGQRLLRQRWDRSSPSPNPKLSFSTYQPDRWQIRYCNDGNR